MDLEHLTKHQIVLLTLLVSFVTSIATGIVTVSLVNQAPPSVTRTINQIVEHTVEKVVPATQGAAAATAVTSIEKTVVVKDDDLAAQSIAKVQQSLVRITQKGSDLLVSRGVIVDGLGTALVDRQALVATRGRQFEAILPDGKRYPAVLRAAKTPTQALGVVDIAVGTSSGFAPATLADTAKAALGQSVIRIGGTGGDTVAVGVVASQSHAGLIESSVSSATPGAVLMTLFGEVLGISTTASAAQGAAFYTTPDLTLLTQT